MGTPWVGVLLRPSETAAEMIGDAESPLLVSIPVMAGICFIFALSTSFRSLMTLPTQIGFVLLYGPPMVLLSSWWGRLCLGWAGKLLKIRFEKGSLISIIAWSWLPVLCISPIATAAAYTPMADSLLLVLTAIGFIWQLLIIITTLRKTGSLSWPRTIALFLIAALFFLCTLTAIGFGIGLLEGDMFKSMVGP